MNKILISFLLILMSGCATNSKLVEDFVSASPPKPNMSKFYFYQLSGSHVPVYIVIDGVEYKLSHDAFFEIDLIPKQYTFELIGNWANVKTGVADTLDITAESDKTYYIKVYQARDHSKPYGERMYKFQLSLRNESVAVFELEYTKRETEMRPSK